jgi:hypothetical protein
MKSNCRPALGYLNMDDPSRLLDIPAYFVLSYAIVTGFSTHPAVAAVMRR